MAGENTTKHPAPLFISGALVRVGVDLSDQQWTDALSMAREMQAEADRECADYAKRHPIFKHADLRVAS